MLILISHLGLNIFVCRIAFDSSQHVMMRAFLKLLKLAAMWCLIPQRQNLYLLSRASLTARRSSRQPRRTVPFSGSVSTARSLLMGIMPQNLYTMSWGFEGIRISKHVLLKFPPPTLLDTRSCIQGSTPPRQLKVK